MNTIFVICWLNTNLELLQKILRNSRQYAELLEYLYVAAEDGDRQLILACFQTFQHLDESKNLLRLLGASKIWARVIKRNIRFCMPKDRSTLEELADNLETITLNGSVSTQRTLVSN